MKRIIATILTLVLMLSLYACGNGNKDNQADTASTNTAETSNQDTTNTEEKQEEVAEETAEVVEETKTREPIDIAETAAHLDTLPREERYAWYEERYGSYFTDHVSFIEDWAANGYTGMVSDMYVDTYIGMPCELLELLNKSTVDDYIVSAVTKKDTENACITDW